MFSAYQGIVMDSGAGARCRQETARAFPGAVLLDRPSGDELLARGKQANSSGVRVNGEAAGLEEESELSLVIIYYLFYAVSARRTLLCCVF